MTRDDAIREIRAVGRICKGPIAPEARLIYADLLVHGLHEQAVLVDLANRGRTTPPFVTGIIWMEGPRGEEMMMHLTDTRIIPYSAVNGCGADFNDVVVSGVWDGEIHMYTCSQCGVMGEYRAPFFKELDS